jgi:hypothetical protein
MTSGVLHEQEKAKAPILLFYSNYCRVLADNRPGRGNKTTDRPKWCFYTTHHNRSLKFPNQPRGLQPDHMGEQTAATCKQ